MDYVNAPDAYCISVFVCMCVQISNVQGPKNNPAKWSGPNVEINK